MAASPRASARRCWKARSTTRPASSLTASFMDYAMPRADDLPSFKLSHTTTLCPGNPLGVKGCGEAGAIGASAAVINAITDAIGNNKLEMPATPDRGLACDSRLQREERRPCIETTYHRPSSRRRSRGAVRQGLGDEISRRRPYADPVMKQRLAAPSDVIDHRARSRSWSASRSPADTLTIKAATTYYDIVQSADVQEVDPGDRASHLGDRRSRGALSRHHRRLDRQQRSGGGLSRGRAGARRHREDQQARRSRPTSSSRACSRPRWRTARSSPRSSFPIPAKAGYAKMRNPASRFALTGVFVAKTKAGDVRVAATGASQNGVMRVPAIEAALKANWSAGALDGVTVSADGLMSRHPRHVGLSRQPDQGDGAARGRPPPADSSNTQLSCERRAAMRAAFAFWSDSRQKSLPWSRFGETI